MSGTLKIGGKTLATHDTSSNKLAFHSDANDTGQLCRAWVNFNASTQTIRSSYNVSSISYGTGDFSIYFNNDMPDANYSVVGSNLWARWIFGIDSTFTSYVRIRTYDEGAGSFGNPTIVCVAIFR